MDKNDEQFKVSESTCTVIGKIYLYGWGGILCYYDHVGKNRRFHC